MVFVELGERPLKPLEQIQQNILYQLENVVQIFTAPEQGRYRLQQCFERLKMEGMKGLCLCIDNVWKWEDLEELLPPNLSNCLPQSTIFMLSTPDIHTAHRFKEVFSCKGEEFMFYKPQRLTENEAQHLFVEMAEKAGTKLQDVGVRLLNQIVPLCAGLPLAVKICGSYFQHPQKRNEWEIVEKQLREVCSLSNNMSLVLKRLVLFQQPNMVDAFVDVALFWNGQPLEVARLALLDDGKDIMEFLLQECLLETNLDYSLLPHMVQTCYCHDLLVTVADKIAAEKNLIYYKHSSNRNSSQLHLRGCSQPDNFLPLPQLNAHQVPSSLCGLQLQDIQSTHFLSIEGLPELRWFNIQGSIESFLSLKELHVRGCPKLASLPDAIGNLYSLQQLVLDCPMLLSLPNSLCKLPSLQKLQINSCSLLTSLPHSLGNLFSLKELDLSRCIHLQTLPDSIGNLALLDHLCLFGCAQLVSLSDSIGKCTSLTYLDLTGCVNLTSLPASIGNLSSIWSLALFNCTNLVSLPDSLGELNSLVQLHLFECSQLQSLPKSIGNLSSLEKLDLHGCAQLASLPSSFRKLSSLEELDLSGCAQMPKSLGDLCSLSRLEIMDCPLLKFLPESIGQLPLSELYLLECTQLVSLPCSIGNLSELWCLDLANCSQLQSLPSSIAAMSGLTVLRLSNCVNLASLPEPFDGLSALEDLDLSGCIQLKFLPDSIGILPSLTNLNLSRCSQLTFIQLHLTTSPLC